MSQHAFDLAIALAPQGDGAWQGHTSPAYANMIGPFGGITAAQAINAVLQHPQRLGEPVAFTINYAAALGDGPFTVLTRAARTNRSTQHWIVEMCQGGQTLITATVFTALRRDTWGAEGHPDAGGPAPARHPAARCGAARRMAQPLRHALYRGRFAARAGTAPTARTAARSCGCATIRHARSISPRSRPCRTSSFRASGGDAPSSRRWERCR